MWIWNCTVSNEDVQRAKREGGYWNTPVVDKVPFKDLAIAQAAVRAFFAPERLSRTSQSEFVDTIKNITPVEGGYDVECIIYGD